MISMSTKQEEFNNFNKEIQKLDLNKVVHPEYDNYSSKDRFNEIIKNILELGAEIRDFVLRELTNENDLVLLANVIVLGNIKNSKNLTYYLELLNHKCLFVVQEVISNLESYYEVKELDEESKEKIIEKTVFLLGNEHKLDSLHGNYDEYYVSLLTNFEDEMVEKLLKLAKSNEVEKRLVAAQTFGGFFDRKVGEHHATNKLYTIKISDKSVEKILQALKELQYDEEGYVRTKLSWTLYDISKHEYLAEKILPILLQTIKDEDIDVRSWSIKALGNIKNQLSVGALLESLKEDYNYETISALENLGVFALEYLVKQLEYESTQVRFIILQVLNKLLLSIYESDMKKIEEFKIKIRTSLSSKTLKELLREKMKDIRKLTIEIMEDIEFVDKDLDLFIRVAKQDMKFVINTEETLPLIEDDIINGDDEIKEFSAIALRKMKSSSSIHIILEALKTSNQSIRLTLLETLGFLKSEKALPELNRIIKSPSFNDSELSNQREWSSVEKEIIAWILGEIGSKEAIEMLKGFVKTQEDDVKIKAIKVLDKKGKLDVINELYKEKDKFSIHVQKAFQDSLVK